MFMAEEELSVEVAEIDRIEVYDVYFAKACEDKILEELTANATSADKEYAGLCNSSVSSCPLPHVRHISPL